MHVSWIFKLIPFPMLMFLAGAASLALTGALFNYELGKQAARETGAPEAVPISQMAAVRGFPWFEETTIQVELREDLTYVYWDGEIDYPLLFLVDPDHEGPVQEVLGAFSYTSLEDADMSDYLDDAYVRDSDHGAIFEFTGLRALFPSVTMEETNWAADELNVTLSENFFYIDPHFIGRDTIIQARPSLYMATGIAGVVLVWLSMIAAIIRKRWKRRANAARTGRATARKGIIAAAAGGIAKLADGDGDEGFI